MMDNRQDYEEELKSRLEKVWSKPQPYQTKIYEIGMRKQKITLGKCIIKVQGITPIYKMMMVIENFGIHLDDLKQLNLNYDEINELYMNINVYRMSIKYLKSIKTRMGLNGNQ